MNRNDRINDEAAALWRELFREPPPAHAEGADMLELIMSRLPESRYERLKTPHLRPTNIHMPTR